MQPYLSICIPTFNRVNFLSSSLERLVDCLASCSDVELLVSDNASEDDTQLLCRKYSDRVRYVRNDVNIGFDRNYIRCLTEARGEYVWIVGDDDVVSPGLVREVLSELRKRKPAIYVLNGENRIKEHGEPKVFDRFDDFFSCYGWHFTWISTTIMKRADVSFLDEAELASSKNFVHISIIIKSFFDKCGFVFAPDVFVVDGENVSSYARDLTNVIRLFGQDLCNIVDVHQSRISRASADSFVAGHCRHFGLFRLKFFANARKNRKFTKVFFEENRKYLLRAVGGDESIMRMVDFSFKVPPIIFKIIVKILAVFGSK